MPFFLNIKQWIEEWIYFHLCLCESCGDVSDKGQYCDTCLEERA
jgi:hypothetical protein